MDKNKDSYAPNEAVRSAEPDFLHENGAQVFLVRKAGIELKVTQQDKMVLVTVSSCNHASQSLAQSIARLQEQIMSGEIKNYIGHNPYAYLLALYNDQGWVIQQLENPDSARRNNSDKKDEQ